MHGHRLLMSKYRDISWGPIVPEYAVGEKRALDCVLFLLCDFSISWEWDGPHHYEETSYGNNGETTIASDVQDIDMWKMVTFIQMHPLSISIRIIVAQ